MLKQLTALLVLICFVTTGCATRHVSAHSQPAPSSANQSKEVTEVKKKAVNLGVGCKESNDAAKLKRKAAMNITNSSVTVRLHSGEKLKGRILWVTDESLALQWISNGRVESKTVELATVSQIRGSLQIGKKVGTGAFYILFLPFFLIVGPIHIC